MTGINYLDETWNVCTGCSGKGCPTKDTCWAKAMVNRFPAIHGYREFCQGKWFKCNKPSGILEYEPIDFERVNFHHDRLEKPLHWKKPRRVGVCFLGDLFDEQVPFNWIDACMKIIAQCKNHSFFVLTKRPERMGEYFRHLAYMLEIVGDVRLPIPNLWNGISITSRPDADRMLPELLRIPGKYWVSIEPMLGEIDVEPWIRPPGTAWRSPISWVIIGCHNRPKLHPCPHDWMIDVVEQCRAAGTPCFVKQVDMGGRVCTDITKFPKELQVRELP